MKEQDLKQIYEYFEQKKFEKELDKLWLEHYYKIAFREIRKKYGFWKFLLVDRSEITDLAYKKFLKNPRGINKKNGL